MKNADGKEVTQPLGFGNDGPRTFDWYNTPLCPPTKVSRKRALELQSIGERISPNPRGPRK